ncbi:MAG: hypothetical protein ACP5JG_15955 [Anaerolineae bacterium]
MPDELESVFRGELVFNGINAVTGAYGQIPLTAENLAQLIQGSPSPEDYRVFVERQKQLSTLANVENRLQRVTEAELSLRENERRVRLEELRFKARDAGPWPVKPGAGDPAKVADVGWAMVFPADMNPSLRERIGEALAPLVALRREQAGDLFRVYEGGTAYRPGERKDQFFQRLGIGSGLADPQEMPYYVLLIGTPEEIPYKFQYQLDVMRGVGRLDFGGDIQAYQDYAQAVVVAERGGVSLPRRAALFAPANPGDKATMLSSQHLAGPLYQDLTVVSPENEIALNYAWELMPPFMGEGQATREQLYRLMGGDPAQTPGLLFAASHGVEFPANHPDQLNHQGALLCQDWPGPGADVKRAHYFAGEDVAGQANLVGRMVVFFACYSAGTPQLDQFALQAFKVREKIAPQGFTAALPKRLLQRGALAVVGHVERAWGYSFISPSGRVENQAFITAMRTLMNGKPVGLATDASFNMRYAELSSDLSSDLEELRWNPGYMSDQELAHRWTANNDARGYVVLGDPAARMPLEVPQMAARGPVDLGVIVEAGEAEAREEAVAPEPEPEEAPEAEEPEAPEPEMAQPAAQFVGWPVGRPEELRPAVAEEGPVEVPQARAEFGPAEPAREATFVSLGMRDQFDELRNALRDFTGQLASSLGKAAQNIVTLDVRTYFSDDLEAVASALDNREETRARLRALTRIAFDGDLRVYMPEKAEGAADETLWTVHKAMVAEAQHNRARFLATMAELATDLLDSLRLGS